MNKRCICSTQIFCLFFFPFPFTFLPFFVLHYFVFSPLFSCSWCFNYCVCVSFCNPSDVEQNVFTVAYSPLSHPPPLQSFLSTTPRDTVVHARRATHNGGTPMSIHLSYRLTSYSRCWRSCLATSTTNRSRSSSHLLSSRAAGRAMRCARYVRLPRFQRQMKMAP